AFGQTPHAALEFHGITADIVRLLGHGEPDHEVATDGGDQQDEKTDCEKMSFLKHERLRWLERPASAGHESILESRDGGGPAAHPACPQPGSDPPAPRPGHRC